LLIFVQNLWIEYYRKIVIKLHIANAISRLITGSNSNIRINYGSESGVYTIRDFDEKSLRDYIIERVALGINDFSRILAETSIDIINNELLSMTRIPKYSINII